MIYSFRAWFVMSALVSKMEHSTTVEGHRLRTVHIMEGTFVPDCVVREKGAK